MYLLFTRNFFLHRYLLVIASLAATLRRKEGRKDLDTKHNVPTALPPTGIYDSYETYS